jgi:hypothetical protein
MCVFSGESIRRRDCITEEPDEKLHAIHCSLSYLIKFNKDCTVKLERSAHSVTRQDFFHVV